MIKSIDAMKLTQDRAKNPPSDIDKNKYAMIVKSLGAEYLAISTVYDNPPAGPDATEVTKAWCNAIRGNNLKVWHRHSWLSDEGWEGVSRNFDNDRIADTKNWIIAHPDLFKDGDIFCPKPEPQNMRVIGINWGDAATARFKSVAAFNLWLRDMTKACKEAFTQIGIAVKVGYWGFDGFVVCGYNNPDHTGHSYLEDATINMMDNLICTDHYPSLVNKPMTDFLQVFKQALPNAKLFIGENGSASNNDPIGQFVVDWNACIADPVCIGYNYWQLGPDGMSERLINSDFSLTPLGNKVKELWSISTPIPTPTPTPTDEYIVHTHGSTKTFLAVTNKGNLWRFSIGEWKKITLPKF